MDPVGPWSAYAASYNRLTNAGGFQNAQGEIHHFGSSSTPAQPSTTSQLLLQAHATSGLTPSSTTFNHNGFLSPPPYDPVFNPLFHQKPHYRPLKQPENDSYNSISTAGNSYDQNNSVSWSQANQLPSPFGILPHESVARSATAKNPYENFSHFSHQSFNQNQYKDPICPEPKKLPPSPKPMYYQDEFKYQKYQNGQNQVLQSCSLPLQSSEYQSPQVPSTRYARNYSPPAIPPIKPTGKPDLEDSQSSPISYSMIASQRNYQTQKVGSQYMPNQQTFRHDSPEYRPKPVESFSPASNTSDCARRPSPLHTQASPSQHTPSPVYPMYNSPITSISSPSPVDSCYNKEHPPLDVTVPRNLPPPFPSVITRTEKTDVRYDRNDYNKWDRQPRFSGYDTQNLQRPFTETPVSDMNSCRGDPMSIVKTLQQQQPEDKQKKRRNSEKLDDFISRVPPPAHHNTNQPSQNSYFEYDRWVPPSKVYTTTSSFSQPFPNNQQMVIPPLPYFPPLQLSNQEPGQEQLQLSALPRHESLSQLPMEETQISEDRLKISQNDLLQNELHTVQSEEQSNTNETLPSLDEELAFLDDESLFPKNEKKHKKKRLKAEEPSGFMASFLQFLQGKKSPPKNQTKIMKSPWVTNPKPRVIIGTNETFPSDPQDDPRYYPLPKTAEGRDINFSDDDKPERFKNGKLKKGKKKKKDKFKFAQEVLPKRELSQRKAKEKIVNNLKEDVLSEESDHEDLDPVWSPQDEEDDEPKGKRRSSSKKKKFKQQRKIIKDTDRPTTTLENFLLPAETLIESINPEITVTPIKPGQDQNSFPFNIGEFVVMKQDLILQNPPIWKVKESDLLQKFKHFVKNGVVHYVNLPSYTGWSPQTTNSYDTVKVKIISQTKQELIIQLLSNNLQIITSGRNIVNRSMQENFKYKPSFQVYTQTLFSQALDPHFLVEIFSEKDEYFLPNVKAIDAVCSGLLCRLAESLAWPKSIMDTAARLPGYRISPGTMKSALCFCGMELHVYSLTICGLPYHPETLQPTDESIPHMETSLCSDCLKYFEAFHKLCHMKCSLYSVCKEKVADQRNLNFDKDSTEILHILLDDDDWLDEKFKETCIFWGYIEKLIQDINRLKTT